MKPFVTPRRVAKAKEKALGLGDEADRARAAQKAEDAAEVQRRQENWAAIDSLVREFVPEAARRGIKTKGFLIKYWLVRSSESKDDQLLIHSKGKWWRLRREGETTYRFLAVSGRPDQGLAESLVDGLREGALRLLNS